MLTISKSAPGRRLLSCLVAVMLWQGCAWLNGLMGQATNIAKQITDAVSQNVDNINTTMSGTVTTLNQQSSAWQGTLLGLEADLTRQATAIEAQAAQHAKDVEGLAAQDAKDIEKQAARDAMDLEKQLVSDVHGVITQVDGLLKDGAQFGQESFNCQTDIFATHARIAVTNFLVGFLNRQKFQGISNRPLLQFAPIICSVNPNGIAVGSWDPATFLVLSGTDLNLLDTQKPDIVIVHADAREVIAPGDVGNRTTNYRYQINVASLIVQNLLANAIKLEVRWKAPGVNKNEIPVVACGGTGQPCCKGACEKDACLNGICGSCGGAGQPCCPGATCAAGGACQSGFCAPCGQNNQPCCNGSVCSSGVCRSGLCAACGTIGQPCCSGDFCTSGQCSLGMCATCGEIGQLCCHGSCNSGVCSAQGGCVHCGSAGESCCANNTCASGSFCSNGGCKVCAPAVPCGSCGGVTQCDGSCSKVTPIDYGAVRAYNSYSERFACCWINYTKVFGGDCHPGWVYHAVTVTKNSGGGACDVVSEGSGNNCRVTMNFHNNGTDGADCTIVIKERRACDAQ